MTRVLITGAAGFVGSHFVEAYLKQTDWELILVDKLTYAANGMSRLKDAKVFEQHRNRVSFIPHDLAMPMSIGLEQEIGSVDYIFHLAAESDVERSIKDPKPFIISNVIGTMEMLEFARRQKRLKAFFLFGTDECFGPCYEGAPSFTEWARFNPGNPYSASKCAADSLALAWSNSYGVPVVCTFCMNIFGERQHPEKFIPKVVRKILKGEMITIHADSTRTKAGSRHYIHARNVAEAYKFLVENIKVATVREKYNIVGEQEIDNLSLVVKIHGLLEKILDHKFPLMTELVDFHSSRPGHDLRYSLNGEKLERLGWTPPKSFEDSLERTIKWSVEPRNLHWLLLD